MKKKHAALIRKLDEHPGGPIELTQNECLALAEVIASLIGRLDLMKTALLAVDAGIWHNVESNTCGLSGAAGVVHLVEAALGKRKLRK